MPSSVIIEHSRTRAVATSNWSAGSRWNGCGNCVDSTTIRGLSSRRIKPGSASAHSIQLPTGRSSFSLPYSVKLGYLPTGDDTNSEDPAGALLEKFAMPGLQSVRRIAAGRPSPQRLPALTDHGIRERNLVALEKELNVHFEGSSPLALRPLKLPARRQTGLVGSAVPQAGVRPGCQLSFLSSVIARLQYK